MSEAVSAVGVGGSVGPVGPVLGSSSSGVSTTVGSSSRGVFTRLGRSSSGVSAVAIGVLEFLTKILLKFKMLITSLF